jgi:hypothetical protein
MPKEKRKKYEDNYKKILELKDKLEEVEPKSAPTVGKAKKTK